MIGLWSKNWLGSLVRKYFEIYWRNITNIPNDQKLWRIVYKKSQWDKTAGKPKASFFATTLGYRVIWLYLRREKKLSEGLRKSRGPRVPELLNLMARE